MLVFGRSSIVLEWTTRIQFKGQVGSDVCGSSITDRWWFFGVTTFALDSTIHSYHVVPTPSVYIVLQPNPANWLNYTFVLVHENFLLLQVHRLCILVAHILSVS